MNSAHCAQLVLDWPLSHHGDPQRSYKRPKFERDCQFGRKKGGIEGEGDTDSVGLIAEDWNVEIIMKLDKNCTRVSLCPGTHPCSGGQEVVRAEWGSNPISWNCCTSLSIHKSKPVVMVTCNKIPLAQHGRRETRLKLNTSTLGEAFLAHTNSRGTKEEPK